MPGLFRSLVKMTLNRFLFCIICELLRILGKDNGEVFCFLLYDFEFCHPILKLARVSGLAWYLNHGWRKKRWFHGYPKGICVKVIASKKCYEDWLTVDLPVFCQCHIIHLSHLGKYSEMVCCCLFHGFEFKVLFLLDLFLHKTYRVKSTLQFNP